MSSQSSPRDVADLLQRQFGPDGAETELQNRYTDASDVAEQERALAALGELRKMQHDSEAVEADCCGAFGCQTAEGLREIDGRVLCTYHAVDYQQR